MKTKEKLAKAIRELEFNPAAEEMALRADSGYYDDFESPRAFPITQLVMDLQAIGALDLARRAIDGEFDATSEEAEAWFQREGRHLFGAKRE